MGTFIFKVLRSFGYALRGIFSAFQERNMKVHGIGAITAIVLGIITKISVREWWLVVLLIALVWSAEMINTGIEELSNIVRDEMKLSYESTQRARDVVAGAVFVIALASLFVGITLFLPKLLAL